MVSVEGSAFFAASFAFLRAAACCAAKVHSCLSSSRWQLALVLLTTGTHRSSMETDLNLQLIESRLAEAWARRRNTEHELAHKMGFKDIVRLLDGDISVLN